MSWLANKKLKRSVIALLATVITLAVLVALIPYGLKWGITSWLDDQGVKAEIDTIKLKLYDGIVHVNAATGSNAAGDGFEIGEAAIHFGWRPLWDKRLTLTKINFKHLKLDVVETSDGLLSVGGLVLPPGESKPQTQETPRQPKEKPWRIIVGEIDLADIRICHRILRQRITTSKSNPDAITQKSNEPESVVESLEEVLHQSACLRLEELHWQGEVVYSTGKVETAQQDIPLQINGNLALKQLDINDLKHKREYLGFKSLSLENVQLAGLQDITIQKLQLQEIRALVEGAIETSQGRGDEIVSLKELFVSPLKIKNLNEIEIGVLNFVGPDVQVQRGESGSWRLKDWLPEKQPMASAKDKQPARQLQLKVKELNFTEDGHAVFYDASLDPPFRVEAKTINIKVLDIDNTQPNKKSQATVDLIIGKHGALHLEGDTVVFAKRPTFDLTGSVKGLDLRPTTSYTIRYLGHRIKHGQLDMELKLKADNGVLDSVLNLQLHKFELEALSPEDQKELDNSMGMPVNTALALLRNKDDTIRLKLPITGDINNPDFDPSDAIFKAMSKSMTTAVINYYTPFGLVTTAGMVLDLATALRFDSVIFEPGKGELAPSHLAYLDKLAKLLNERPGVHLVLCGRVNPADHQVLFPAKKAQQEARPSTNKDAASPAFKLTEQEKQALLNLAMQRADGIQDYLVQAGKVTPDRLILCDPVVELQAESISGVEISL